MNKKKCPKCGEENPADAAMCWACYTPLGDAVPAGGAASGTTAPAGKDLGLEDEEKEKIPPWQLAVIGAGLLTAIGFGVFNFMPSGNTSGGSDDFDDMPMDPPISQEAQPTQQSSPVTFSSSGTASVTPTEAPFSVVVSPNPRYSTGTMAIVPKDKNVSGATAASYAAYVRRQYAAQMKRWSTFYVYVFSDQAQAQEFAKIMRQRRGAPLSSSDYASLTPLWRAATARYEYSARNGQRIERVVYPSQSPNNWWNGQQ